jgi:hypothetical protein
MIDMAERRARQQCIADLPDAAEFARALLTKANRPVALALANAYWDQRAPGYRARTPQDAANLRRWGLCDYPSALSAGLLLTNFGVDVRRHVLGAGGDR